jgi:hypothetical protein
MTGAFHWAAEYIGLPYHPEGEGPDSFHCWALVRYASEKQFNRPLPEIDVPKNALGQMRAIRDELAGSRWQKLQSPCEGACVVLRQGRRPGHIGMWVETATGGGVLHCIERLGVVFQPIDQLSAHGYRISGIYQFKG